jgi:hypothetical protein
MTLQEFVDQVNTLAQAEIKKRNSQGGSPFQAVHTPYPESMLRFYFDMAYTPKEALCDLKEDIANEAAWEARAS